MSPANNKYHCHHHLLKIILYLTFGVALIFIVYMWTSQSDSIIKGTHKSHRSDHTPPAQWIQGLKSDEHRIAQRFEADTLPGLMRCGLIKKYERRQTGTVLFVAGKVWKARSRFFKESLLLEALVYNKVNGYALETRIVDHYSQQLYAHAISADRKEFYD
jgi:hypothetical protein